MLSVDDAPGPGERIVESGSGGAILDGPVIFGTVGAVNSSMEETGTNGFVDIDAAMAEIEGGIVGSEFGVRRDSQLDRILELKSSFRKVGNNHGLRTLLERSSSRRLKEGKNIKEMVYLEKLPPSQNYVLFL